jgi:uncharacterized protein YndB with AHSA1/START domain
MPGRAAVEHRFEHVLRVSASPERVLAAFFDPAALSIWWQAVRSVTTPALLGVYAIEWEPTSLRDDLLGPLGGIFHGRVVDYDAARGFFVADAFWMPPEGDPIGPMGLDVACRHDGPATALQVRQAGYEESARWRRYYEVVTRGWQTSLRALRAYVERGREPPPTP